MCSTAIFYERRLCISTSGYAHIVTDIIAATEVTNISTVLFQTFKSVLQENGKLSATGISGVNKASRR